MTTHYKTVDVNGTGIFYREAGDPGWPTVLLLHGFPLPSHMFRDLIPELAEHYHVIAPDLPGFGQSAMKPRQEFSYTSTTSPTSSTVLPRSSGFRVLRSTSSTTARRSACDRRAAPRADHHDHHPERQRLP